MSRNMEDYEEIRPPFGNKFLDKKYKGGLNRPVKNFPGPASVL
jgi:hypothetical protein